MTRTAKALSRDMRHVVDEVEHLLHEAGSAGSGTVSDLKSRVGQAMESARARLDAVDTSVRSGARYAATRTDDLVHERPWQAMAVGAVIGLAIGLLVSRR